MFLARYGSAFRRAKTFEVNRSMRDMFKEIADSLALAVEASAVLIIAYGAIEAIGGSIRAVARQRSKTGQRKEVWLRFGVWLLLGLEFELAADIIRTAISPTWTDYRTAGSHRRHSHLPEFLPRERFREVQAKIDGN